MVLESPQNLLYLVGGAFLAGWLTGKIGAYFGQKFRTRNRDPRDDRIRSLEAELRIARSNLERAHDAGEETRTSLRAAENETTARDETIAKLENTVRQLRVDLKDSVQKTRELRAELSDRATENLKSEVKLREVETELSVVQASSELISTGVLDYTVNDDEEDDKDLSKAFRPGL